MSLFNSQVAVNCFVLMIPSGIKYLKIAIIMKNIIRPPYNAITKIILRCDFFKVRIFFYKMFQSYQKLHIFLVKRINQLNNQIQWWCKDEFFASNTRLSIQN